MTKSIREYSQFGDFAKVIHIFFDGPKSSFGEHNFVSKCTNPAYYLVEATVVKSLQNPAWVFRGNVVSHMDPEW